MVLSTVKIFKKLLDDFSLEGNISSVVNNLDGTYTFSTCDTYHVMQGSYIEINGDDYLVKSVDTDINTITIYSNIAITSDTFLTQKPYFFHGTPIDTTNVLSTILDSSQKYPMIYLLEIIKDKFIADKSSIIDRESNLNIFFLAEANFQDWDVDQHYSDAIIPMMNLCSNFIDYLKKHPDIGTISDFEVIYHAKFGMQLKEASGHVKNLFNDNTSGVQLRVTLPIKKTLICLYH